MITTFLHPVTRSVSAASEVQCEEPGCELLLPPVTPNYKKTEHLDSGFKCVAGRVSMTSLPIGPSCTVHCVENLASHPKDGVGQCTVPAVLLAEADQTAVPFYGISCHEGRQFLVDINENFIYINEATFYPRVNPASV